ncbi:MAG TPA: hypothetical protein VEK31_00900 [Xanthobacteraceae bacterium]|nr:hypothetical protein [Xanthobacteraceae bacterium]
MSSHLLYSALGVALVAGSPTAGAQTVIAPQLGQPVGAVIVPQQSPALAASVAQPTETIQTTEVRTIGRVPAHRQVVTTRTITRRVVSAPAAVAGTITAAPRPLYDTAVPAAIPQPLYDVAVPTAVPQPLYDAAAPASGDDYYYYSGAAYDAPPAAVVAAPVAAGPMTYRYVYEPDRILVIDPTTNIAVQAIPR